MALAAEVAVVMDILSFAYSLPVRHPLTMQNRRVLFGRLRILWYQKFSARCLIPRVVAYAGCTN